MSQTPPRYTFRVSRPTADGIVSERIAVSPTDEVYPCTDAEAAALVEPFGRNFGGAVFMNGEFMARHRTTGDLIQPAKQILTPKSLRASSMILRCKAWITTPTASAHYRTLAYFGECVQTPALARLASGNVIPTETRVAVVTNAREVLSAGDYDLADDGTVWLTKHRRAERYTGAPFCGTPRPLVELRDSPAQLLVEVERGRWRIEELA